MPTQADKPEAKLISLSQLTNAPQTVSVGYGVSITFTPPTYAMLKSAEHAARRLARGRVGDAGEAALASEAAADDALVTYEDLINGLAEEIMLDGLFETCATAWTGIADEDGQSAAPLTTANWIKLRNGLPRIAQAFNQHIQFPLLAMDAEGNA